ncbi:MAG: AgmX/PglI C-terminal domain-containing protein [Bdellovibrionota bacterium]
MREHGQVARYVGVLVAVLVGFGFYNHYRRASPHEAPSGLIAVGVVTAVSGSVEHRWPGRIEIMPLEAGATLHVGELVRTNERSMATLSLKNGAQIKVLPDSQVVAEFDATREGSTRVTIVSGDAEITKPGPNGLFRLYKEGREVTDGRNLEAIVIPQLGSAPSVANAVPRGQEVVTATTPVESPTPGPLAAKPKDGKPTDLSTLTNDEIRRTFAKNTGFFQRCYLSHLSRKGTSPAHSVTIGFTIQPTGKVAQAKVVRSEFEDSTLNKCVVETVERTSFRPFTGEAIPILEFPVELN